MVTACSLKCRSLINPTFVLWLQINSLAHKSQENPAAQKMRRKAVLETFLKWGTLCRVDELE